jgi:para-nitrobenzyl esterase
MDVVKTEAGYISGTVLGEPDKPVYVYRGIPYAAPPIGDFRWKPPRPVTPWSGIRECTSFSLQAAQFPDVNLSKAEQKTPSSEDCLYLNVLTPATKGTEKLPVMVWFHVGALRYSNSNLSLYNGPALPQHGVVLVTVNSRLGVLGLLVHPLLSRESPNGVSGNYMFLDLIAALKWVSRNITAFGGDPDNVTIFGESGGGTKVISLLASPLARGLFHKAICESGRIDLPPPPMQNLSEYGERLFTKLGIGNKQDALTAARAIKWEKIIEVDQALNVELGSQFVFRGCWDVAVDGWFVPDIPSNVFKSGNQNPVPFITLANLGELTGPGYLFAPKMIPGYVGLLSAASKSKAKGYAGIFNHVPHNWKQDGSVAAHGMEVPYVFGALDDLAFWKMWHFLWASAGAKSPDPFTNEGDRAVSESMMRMWTNFARTGNPSLKEVVDWPAYNEATDQYLYIGESLHVKSGFSGVAQK